MVYYFAFLCLAIIAIANAAVSPKSLDSDISILIHNDLLGTHIAYPPKLESGIKDWPLRQKPKVLYQVREFWCSMRDHGKKPLVAVKSLESLSGGLILVIEISKVTWTTLYSRANTLATNVFGLPRTTSNCRPSTQLVGSIKPLRTRNCPFFVHKVLHFLTVHSKTQVLSGRWLSTPMMNISLGRN